METLDVNRYRFANVISDINKELQDRGYLTEDDTIRDSMAVEMTCTVPKAKAQLRQLMSEMRAQNFDVIVFATYRTACKLRFIQKQTHLYQIDIWNMIEAFRENLLHTVEPVSEIDASRLESVLHTAFCQLNKRLPQAQSVHVDRCVSLTLNWLMSAYDRESTGHIRAFAVKVALAHLSSGKLIDKLRYIFTLISDSSGHMIRSRFDDYLRDLLLLPAAVYEGTSFRYSEEASRTFFDSNPVTVNDFLSVMMTIPGRQCLMWLPALNRMAHVENVIHPVQCEACHRASIAGFRYKCRRCCNYNLCQDCFWRGKTSGNHSNDHDMKEHTSYRSGSKQVGRAIKKSFDCVPSKVGSQLPHFPDTPQKTLDLSFIVPPTPVAIHNGFKDHSSTHSLDLCSLHTSTQPRSLRKLTTSAESCRADDEHRLIARYAARLAADENKASRSTAELNLSVDTNQAQRELIAQLEAKNREIMREIQRLRLEQEAFVQEGGDTSQYNPTLLAELRLLRQRKDELEARMQALQESRKDLMVQLETLMKLLKNHPTSPRSTPNSSPRSRSGLSPTFTAALANRAATSPAPSASAELSLTGLGGDVQQAFTVQTTSGPALTRTLRNDLLMAADSVTNAMSSLVKELHSDDGSEEEYDDDRLEEKFNEMKFDEEFMSRSGATEDVDMSSWGRDDLHWRMRQEAEFLAQLRARRQRSSANSSQTTSDNEQDGYPGTDEGESLTRTDDESYVGTDDLASCQGERLDDIQSVSMRTDDEGAELPETIPKEMTSSRYTTDEDSFLQTDDESFIRTDDEEGGNTDWEESTRRWVNR
ncbi:dystrobrevin beta-like [Physella acuta]|uniref:dystrobrevin beta-like n=1 Tax=Physella acuta TaxID=109671 RepID=UPI0027DCC8F4|nr:dystrobrevin beta-like [Physella acuta]